mmetsp:Transcript_4335/g.13715  ORF Transcript_4335/g.13715 Transcript_4335/m.13715 type:complete len:400 (-) Transcript_4335:219-1418(-)
MRLSALQSLTRTSPRLRLPCHRAMSSFDAFEHLKVTRRGAVLDALLDRPKKLNALDVPMIRECAAVLDAAEWTAASEEACVALVVRGAGGKAFCAGGDVAAIRGAGLAGPPADGSEPLYEKFFREEYHVNHRLGTFSSVDSRIKQVSLWDGIVMGGGVGLSVHGRFRVATEKVMLAMPEVGIGLFPDVGACHKLATMPGKSGEYAALTGARLGLADLLHAGLATHAVASKDLDALVDDVSKLDASLAPEAFDAAVDACLSKYPAPAVDPSPLKEHATLIDSAFAGNDVAGTLAALDADGSEFAAKAAKAIRRGSPTAAAVSLEAVLRAEGATLAEVLRADFRVASAMVAPSSPLPDFYEGVRAALVDKDRNPQWGAAPSAAAVAAHFDKRPAPWAELEV